MVSKISDDDEGTGYGLRNDYKRCHVFDTERSDSGSYSGEESSAFEDGDDDDEGCETENGEVDQGGR